jgi:FlaA1/EpsC-like NDP-sugar epimerase
MDVITRRKLGFVFLDLLCINLSLILAFLIRYDGIIPDQYKVNLLAMCLLASIIAISFFRIFQLYNSLWKYVSLSEMLMIQGSSLVSCLTTYIMFSIFGYYLPFSVYVLYGFMLITFLGGSRVAYRILRRFKSILNNIILKEYKRVLIVGAGEAGALW